MILQKSKDEVIFFDELASILFKRDKRVRIQKVQPGHKPFGHSRLGWIFYGLSFIGGVSSWTLPLRGRAGWRWHISHFPYVAYTTHDGIGQVNYFMLCCDSRNLLSLSFFSFGKMYGMEVRTAHRKLVLSGVSLEWNARLTPVNQSYDWSESIVSLQWNAVPCLSPWHIVKLHFPVWLHFISLFGRFSLPRLAQIHFPCFGNGWKK